MTVKELIDPLMGFPEDEKVMIPNFNSNLDHNLQNVVSLKVVETNDETS